MLDNRKPRLPEACRTPLIKPRERTGQLSMTSAAPTGHSAPMPMPNKARNSSRNHRVGEKPAMKLLSEYQAIEIINGVLRPIRSASQPAPTAPTRRIHKVIVRTNATAVSGTWNSSAIGFMINRKTVKSKASRVHPSQAAHQAYHWSLVGSFHQGMLFMVSTAAMLSPSPSKAAPPLEPCRQCKAGLRECRGYFSTTVRRRAGRTGPKGAVSSDGQVGHQDLSSCLRAQQNGDKEDRQAHDRGNQDRTRKADLVEGRVPNQER